MQFADYNGAFNMCLVYADSKVPVGQDWQLINNVINEPVPGYNHGLVHEHSGTCAIDIDNIERAREIAATRGLDLDSYFQTGVQIQSGVSNHGKLIYRVPFPIESKKISHERKDVINFRCIGNQDLLPPSIHPDTKAPYEWVGDWQNIPTIPMELFEWWNELLNKKEVPTTPPINDPGTTEVEKLLRYCDPNTDRMTWINIGFSCHSLNPDYFYLWHNWSATASEHGKYTGEMDCWNQWRSFKDKPNGVTGKSLYYYARQGGYGPTLQEALQIFREIGEETDDAYIFEERYVPEIPLDVIPPILKEYAIELGYKIGANPIIPIASGLTALCVAADARSRLELQQGYLVPPVLWNIVIAPPAAKKSPASKPMYEPFRRFEAEDVVRFTKEAQRYESVLSAYSSAKKNHLKACEDPEWIANGMQQGHLPTVPQEPKPPVKLRHTITDITSQKAVDLIEQRPAGMGLILDEGKAWLNKLINPNTTEDRSFWTVSYESDSYTFDRVTRGSIHIENLAISTYINVQPTVIAKCVKELEEDGLFQRFTPFIVPVENCSNISQEYPAFMSLSSTWENMLRRIKAAGVGYYGLDEEARKEFKQFELWLNQKQKEHALIGSPSGFQSAIGKMLGLCGRLVFVFHLGTEPENKVVSVDRVKDVVTFLKDYVYYTLRDVSLMSGDQPFDEWIFDWIITGEEESFSTSNIKQSARRQLEKYSPFEQQKRIEESLTFLAETGVIMQIEQGTNRTDTYAVNPLIREKYHERRLKVIRAKYSQKMDRERKVRRAGKRVKSMPVRGEHLL
jgi:hypothetical protein